MIYPDRGTTKAILGKMRTSRPSEQWDVVRLPTGYQVVKVTKLPDYMPSAKAAPVVKPKLANKLLPAEVEAIQAHEAKCKRLHSMLPGGGSPPTARAVEKPAPR